MSDQITWNPRVGSSGDDKYAWPKGDLMVAGPVVTGNQTIPTVNAKTHFAQIQAEITRRSQIVGYDTAYVAPGATVDRRMLTPRMIFAAQNIRLKESLARFDFGPNLQFNFGTTNGARAAGALYVFSNVPYDPDWANITTAYVQFRNHDKVYKVTAWTRTRIDFTPALQAAVPASTPYWMFVRPERMIEQEFVLRLRKALSEQPQSTLGGTVWANHMKNYQIGGPATQFAYDDVYDGASAWGKIGSRVFYGRGYLDAPIAPQYLEYLLRPYTNSGSPFPGPMVIQGPVITWGGYLWAVFSEGNQWRVCRSSDGADWQTMYQVNGPFAPPSYPRFLQRGLSVGTAAPFIGLSILGYKYGGSSSYHFVAHSADGTTWTETDIPGTANSYLTQQGFHFQMQAYIGGPETWWVAPYSNGDFPPYPKVQRWNTGLGAWESMDIGVSLSEALLRNYFVRIGTDVVSYAGARYSPSGYSYSTKYWTLGSVSAGANIMNCVVGNSLYGLQNVADVAYKSTRTNLLYRPSLAGTWATVATWVENMPVGQNAVNWPFPWFIEGCRFQ